MWGERTGGGFLWGNGDRRLIDNLQVTQGQETVNGSGSSGS